METTRQTGLMSNMPTDDRQRQRNRITNLAFRKKNPNYQRLYLAIRDQPDALRIPLRERPSLWRAPELDSGGSRRDGLWLSR
jgi:hypothetical protein